MSKALQSARYSGVLLPVTLASAPTVAIGAAIANAINLTGTSTITAFDVAPSGTRRTVVFQGAMTLTHNATTLTLPGTRNIFTTPGDTAEFLSVGGGNWICTRYNLANGTSLLGTSQDHIRGFNCVWNSASSVSFTPGEAYIPGTGKVLKTSGTITLTGLTGSVGIWYHAYLFDNAGTVTVEMATTAPDSPYYNGARGKTGDASRRYLISIFCGAAGAILQFRHIEDRVDYLTTSSNPYYIVINSAPTVNTKIILAGTALPITAHSAFLYSYNGTPAGPTGSVFYFCSTDMGNVSTTNYSYFQVGGETGLMEMPLGSSDGAINFYSANVPSGGGVLVGRVTGYKFRR